MDVAISRGVQVTHAFLAAEFSHSRGNGWAADDDRVLRRGLEEPVGKCQEFPWRDALFCFRQDSNRRPASGGAQFKSPVKWSVVYWDLLDDAEGLRLLGQVRKPLWDFPLEIDHVFH